MSYEIPPSRRSSIDQVLAVLEKAGRVILTTHKNGDGDGAGCEAALLSLLLEEGIQAWIVNPTPFPDLFRFLVPDPTRILEVDEPETRRRCRAADLCIVVDTGEVSRIGRVGPLVEDLGKVIIDHHPPGSDALEGVSFRDAAAAAAGELVFDLAWTRDGPWTRPLVEGLYVALLTDTGSFRHSNVTPEVHRIAAELVSRGADPEELHRRIYGRAPLRRYRLLEKALATLDVSSDGRVAWMTVPAKAFRELACSSEDLEGLVDFPRELDGVEVGLLFREVAEGSTKVSFRSNGPADVNVLARSFGGGGHARASGALIEGKVEQVRDRVVARSIEYLHDEAGAPGSGDAGLAESREPQDGEGVE